MAAVISVERIALLALLCGCAVPLSENDLTLTDFQLTWTGEPGNLDITSGDGTITCDMTVTTTGLSAKDAICRFVSPAGVVRDCFTAGPPVGDVWTCDVTILRFSESGTWTVDYVSVRDTGNNFGNVTGAQLDADGKETEVVVTSPAADTTAPSIESFVASPADLQTTGGQLFTCAVTASDTGSGIKDRGCTFTSPDGTQSLTCISGSSSCETLSMVDGEEGSWPLYNIFARDNLLNTIVLSRDDVIVLGGTDSVQVGTTASPIVWPTGPATDCTLNSPDIATQGGCICEGVEYASGYCCSEGFSWSACSSTYLYATPAGAGTNSGADWDNALVGLPTGSGWTRDRVYWISEGTFATDLLTFSEPASGVLGITIKKATDCGDTEDCTATGWTPAMGDEQSVFEQMNFTTVRWTIDGTTQNGYGSGLEAGILITTSDLLDSGGNESLIGINADQVVIRNADIDVGFVGTTSTMTAGACSGVRVPAASTVNDLVLDRVEIHNVADDGVVLDDVDTVIIAQDVIHKIVGCGSPLPTPCGSCNNGHGDGIEIFSSDNVTISDTVIYDIINTSAIIVDDGSSGSNPSLNLTVRNTIGYVDKVPGGQLPITIKYVDGATFTGNVFWGVQSGDRFGGCYFNGNGVDNLVFKNNICTNINFNFSNNPGPGNSEFDPAKHDLSNNQFGGLITTEYPDGESTGSYQVGDPLFANIPYSSNIDAHSSEGMEMSDFLLQPTSPALDFGTTIGAAWAINAIARPVGPAYDPGVHEAAGLGGAGGTGGTGGAGGAACGSTPTDLTATNDSWTPQDAADPATGDLDFTIFAKTSGLDSLVWVTDGAISTWSDAAMLARFNPSGKIDAFSGSGYVAENAFPAVGSYAFDTWYEFQIAASVGTQTYYVDVRECGAPSFTRILTQGDFRTTIASATHYGLWASTGTTVDAGDAVWTPAACVPLACADYDPNSCGAAPDGCGDFLSSCGTCGAGETCHPTDWDCCTLLDCTDYDPDSCGTPPDGCGGFLSSCGTCGGGTPDCLPSFSCGTESNPMPTPSNTGPTGPLNAWSYGSKTITTDGGLYENFDTNAIIEVYGNNNTFRNCRITSSAVGGPNIRFQSASSGNTIDHCELVYGSPGLQNYGDNNTVTYCHIHDQPSDNIKWTNSTGGRIANSLIEKGGHDGVNCDGHVDPIQATGADGLVVYYNTFQGGTCPCDTGDNNYFSSHILIEDGNLTSTAYVYFEGNWFNGFGGTVNALNGGSLSVSRLKDNRWGNYIRLNAWGAGNFINDGGNVWHCDDTPITAYDDPKPSCMDPFPGVCPGTSIY